MSHRFPILVCAFLPILSGCAPGPATEARLEPASPLPRIALAEVGDSVVYLEQNTAFSTIARETDTLVVTSRHDAVVHVMRTAPDTLEGFFEHLLLRFEGANQTRNVDTRSLIGERFVLHDDDGRIETVSAPALSSAIRQMSDLRRQFEDFFLRLPARALDLGAEWVDTVRFGANEGESAAERLAVTRFRVRADTVVEGIAARIVDYQSALETRLRSASSTEGVLVSTLAGAEEGTFVYAPERAVLLRRHRVGMLEGELVIEGNLDTRRFPQSYSYESRVELIPPIRPGGRRPGAPAAAEPPAIP